MPSTYLEHPPALRVEQVSLFLDLDGTLAEITPRPSDVAPSAARTAILRRLRDRLDGRVAILTGRTLEDADRILEGSVPTAAAVHGLVRRSSGGQVEATMPSPGIPAARAELRSLVEMKPGLMLEEKEASLALHYRNTPEAEAWVLNATLQIAQDNGLALQAGAMVSELRTPGPNKGDALRAIMAMSPFIGATPIMVGDDMTDETAFKAATELGGYGVLVGAPRSTAARYRLDTVNAVMNWLQEALH